MTNDLVITLLILLVAAVLLLSDRVRADLVALLVVVALGVSGVLTAREAFSGFSSSAVVTMAAIFVLVAGLQVTGVTDQAGRLLQRLAGAGERRLLVAVMAIGALLSLFMNNIAAAAILLPAVSGLASRTQVRLSRLLMPLAFATILGGMATLFTTTNIIVSGILRSQGLRRLWRVGFSAGRRADGTGRDRLRDPAGCALLANPSRHGRPASRSNRPPRPGGRLSPGRAAVSRSCAGRLGAHWPAPCRQPAARALRRDGGSSRTQRRADSCDIA